MSKLNEKQKAVLVAVVAGNVDGHDGRTLKGLATQGLIKVLASGVPKVTALGKKFKVE
jgi:hypothetical protein